MKKVKAVKMTMLSIPRTLHLRIKELARKDGRSMRSYLDIVITKEEQEDIVITKEEQEDIVITKEEQDGE